MKFACCFDTTESNDCYKHVTYKYDQLTLVYAVELIFASGWDHLIFKVNGFNIELQKLLFQTQMSVIFLPCGFPLTGERQFENFLAFWNNNRVFTPNTIYGCLSLHRRVDKKKSCLGIFGR